VVQNATINKAARMVDLNASELHYSESENDFEG
jgi:hypothetical protein